MNNNKKAKLFHFPADIVARFEKIIEEYKDKKGMTKLYPWQALDMLMKEHEEKK